MKSHWREFTAPAVTVSLLLCWWSYDVTFPGLKSDTFRYLLIADAWGLDNARSVEINAWYWLDSQFPPLYSLVLFLVGAGSDSLQSATVLNAVLLGIGFGLCALFLVRIEVSYWSAGLVLFALIASRSVLLHAPQVLSEHLFVPLSMLALVCLTQQGRAWMMAAAAIVSIATMTRAVGLALVPAVLLAAGRQSWATRFALLIAMTGPWIVWTLVRADLADLSGNASYTTLLANILQPDNAGSLVDTMRGNLVALAGAWTAYWLPSKGLSHWLVMPLYAVLFIGLFKRLRMFGPETVYALAYVAIVLVWPGALQAERFLFALMPALLIALAVGADVVVRAARWTRWPITAVVVAACAIGVGDLGRRALWESPPELDGYRRLTYWQEAADVAEAVERVGRLHATINTMRAASVHVPENACIYTQYPEWIAMYSNRFGVPVPVPGKLDQLRDPARRQCDFLFVTDISTVQFPYPEYYPANQLTGSISPLMTARLPGTEGDTLVAALAKFR